MVQRQFDERLDHLVQRLLSMSHDVETIVSQAAAIASGSPGDSDQIRDLDRKIDLEEVGVEEEAIELLALYQPMATDLRLIVTVIKINNDLERIGDHAVNIAEAAERIRKARDRPDMPPELEEMAHASTAMLRDALDAFVRRNAEEAQAVRARDDFVDRLHESVFRIMLTHMLEADISACLQVIMISRNLERIADLATNIAEDVVFMVQGITVRHQGPVEPEAPQVD